MKNSVVFKNLKEKRIWRDKQKKDIWLQLNLEKRRNKQEFAENTLLSLENSMREQYGLKTFNNYEDYLKREEDPEELEVNYEILLESANILSDFIEYSFRPIVVSIDKAG